MIFVSCEHTCSSFAIATFQSHILWRPLFFCYTAKCINNTIFTHTQSRQGRGLEEAAVAPRAASQSRQPPLFADPCARGGGDYRGDCRREWQDGHPGPPIEETAREGPPRGDLFSVHEGVGYVSLLFVFVVRAMIFRCECCEQFESRIQLLHIDM